MFGKLFWGEIDGHKDGAMKDRLMRRGHTFQMTAIALLPGGGKAFCIVLYDFLLPQGHLDYPPTENSCRTTKQRSTQGPSVLKESRFSLIFSCMCVCRGAMMRMGTAQGAAWSFPPLTCTSWRVESLPTTGPYRTKERSPWASVSLHLPASPDMVRLHL